MAALKGAILSGIVDAQIVDVSNEVEKHNYGQAGYILRAVWQHFPVGTIHINLVSNPKVDVKTSNTNNIYICIKHKGHYFLGPDNGVFSLVIDETPDAIVQLNSVLPYSGQAFPGLTMLVPVACGLAKGVNMFDLGIIRENIYRQFFFNPSLEENRIVGNVIYNDSYGNAITNISKANFEAVFGQKPFQIELKGYQNFINKISDSYSDVAVSEKLALFNSLGFLELAQNFASAKNLLGLRVGTTIRIDKYDNKNSKNDFQNWGGR